MQSTLWCEKYRPATLMSYIGNTNMKQKFADFITAQDIPHLLLTGPAGTGKTTAAKILINSIDCDSMLINASDDNNIETVRGKIRGFASTVGFGERKIILLDEFDGFTRQGQEALRNLMEVFSNDTRFILTANYIERISEPIVSRTQHFEVVPPSRKDVAVHLGGILRAEKVEFTLSDLKVLLDAYFPDIRKIINECQSSTHNSVLTLNTNAVINGDFKLRVLEILKTPAKTQFNEIRQVIADSQVRDYSDLYRILFDRVDDYAGANISAVIIRLAEGQYKSSLVVDKEITMMATIAEILTLIKG